MSSSGYTYSTWPVTGSPGSEGNLISAAVPATIHPACASGTSAITHRLPVPVMVIATIAGVIIEPSFSSSSVTTPEIGAKYGTRPDARPAFEMRPAVPASSPSAPRRCLEASIRSRLPIFNASRYSCCALSSIGE